MSAPNPTKLQEKIFTYMEKNKIACLIYFDSNNEQQYLPKEDIKENLYFAYLASKVLRGEI